MDPRPGRPTAAKPPSGCCVAEPPRVPSCRRFGGLGPAGRGGCCCCCIEGGGPGGRGGFCCCCIEDGALAKISCPYGDDSTESPAAVAVASAASPVGDRSDCSEYVGDAAAAGLGGVIQSSPASFPKDALVRMGLPANVTFGVGSCSGLKACDVAGCSCCSRSCCCLGCLNGLGAAPPLGLGITLALSDVFSAGCLNELAGDVFGETVVLGDTLPLPLSVVGAVRGAGTDLIFESVPFAFSFPAGETGDEGLLELLAASFFSTSASSLSDFLSAGFFSSRSFDEDILGDSAGEEPEAESKPSEVSGSGAFARTDSVFSGLEPELDSVSIEDETIGDLGLPLLVAPGDAGLPMSCDPRLFAFLPLVATAAVATAAATASCRLAAAAAAAFLRRSYAPWSAARLV
mmetsp:Transcript_14294/g.56424  ORF Transcript_14294/g.56424 Transcript_14294/m.56424 type:complete len:403 (-) Transcript_14294:4197-5405(-)